MKRAIILLTFLTCVLTARKTYTGYKMFRLYPKTDYQVETLALLYDNTENFDFWTTMRESGQIVDLNVAEIAHDSFKNILYHLNVTYEAQIEHVDKAFNRERKELMQSPKAEEGGINFQQYHRYDVIMAYLDKLAKTYDKVVTLEKIGKSFEGRDIKVVKISNGDGFNPGILIDAGIGGREWICPAQALYFIKELVENSNNKDLIANVDWYIIPLINPDAYEYSHTTDRLWRKTRSKGTEHYGVNINRNFDINWGGNLSSSSEFDWNYQGPKPFSEPETATLKQFIEDNSDQIKLYLSLQSFGPSILYPFGYTNEPPNNVKKLHALAHEVSEATERSTGTVYVTKPSSTDIHLFAGSSVDWAVEKAGIEYAYTIELPSPGFLGFDFPTHKLEKVVKEAMVVIEKFHKFVENNFVIEEKNKDEL